MNEETTKMVLSNLELINRSLAKLQTDVSDLKTDVSDLKTDVSDLKTDVGELKTDVGELKVRMDRVEEEQKTMRFILENDISKKIDIIGEGHVDLMRRFDEAMELQILNLTIDMRWVKQKLGMI